MNKVIYLLTLISFCFITDTKAQEITEIRKRYTSVKDMISMQQMDENMMNRSNVCWMQNVPGIGPQRCDYTMYFTPLGYDANGNIKQQKICLIENSYNIAARKYYEEYLYNESEELIFVYTRQPSDDGDAFIDTRIYQNEGTILKVTINEVRDGKTRLLNSNDSEYIKSVIDRGVEMKHMFWWMRDSINPDKQ